MYSVCLKLIHFAFYFNFLFFKDNLTGKGFLKDKTSQYEGQFLDNMKNGKGILTDFTTGTIYEGEYFKNELRGQGVHIYPNGIDYLVYNFCSYL